MVRISREAIASNQRTGRRISQATSLDHEEARSFAERGSHLLAERSARTFAEDAEGMKAGEERRCENVDTAREDQISAASANEVRAEADRLRRRRARGRDGDRRPLD